MAIDAKKNTTGKVPYPGNVQPYPIFVSTTKGSDDLAYGLTKAVMTKYEDFKESGPSMNGYELKRQNLTWVFPYHPGSIKFFKEAGVWGDAESKHNQMMKERQAVLAAAWKAHMAASGSASDDDFNKGWQAARAAALDKAGMDVPFRTW